MLLNAGHDPSLDPGEGGVVRVVYGPHVLRVKSTFVLSAIRNM